jgi:hypothetical protein
MRLSRHESQEIISVTGDQNQLVRMRETEDGAVVRVRW